MRIFPNTALVLAPTCNPLEGGMGPAGEEVTEDLSMKFEKTTPSFTSISRLEGGGQVKFEGKGKR
jgi:hypothetical protein